MLTYRIPMENTPKKITVLGAGAWGAVLAGLLARKGHNVLAWDFIPVVVEALDKNRSHPKLPNFVLPDSVRLTSNLREAFDFGAEAVVVVVPSHGLRGLAKEWQTMEVGKLGAPWIICTKGIEEESLLPMTGVVEDVWGSGSAQRIAALSGPTFAAEVARELPTTVCVASSNPELSAYFQNLFITSAFRVYTQDDVIGVEIGAALKNVIAIAAGVCDGLQLGDNARAALITRGLAEITRLGVSMGARPETFSGLTGMGDLVLTCCGNLSRNHSFGILLSHGSTATEAQKKIGMVVEGVRTALSAYHLAKSRGVQMPIVNEIYAVLNDGKSPKDAVRNLMDRAARPERD